MIYCYDSNNLPVNKPIWAFMYNRSFYNDQLKVSKMKPTLGHLEKHAQYSYDAKFIPDDTSIKPSAYTKYMYADTYEEAVASYNRIIQGYVDRLNKEIQARNAAIAKMSADTVGE